MEASTILMILDNYITEKNRKAGKSGLSLGHLLSLIHDNTDMDVLLDGVIKYAGLNGALVTNLLQYCSMKHPDHVTRFLEKHKPGSFLSAEYANKILEGVPEQLLETIQEPIGDWLKKTVFSPAQQFVQAFPRTLWIPGYTPARKYILQARVPFQPAIRYQTIDNEFRLPKQDINSSVCYQVKNLKDMREIMERELIFDCIVITDNLFNMIVEVDLQLPILEAMRLAGLNPAAYDSATLERVKYVCFTRTYRWIGHGTFRCDDLDTKAFITWLPRTQESTRKKIDVGALGRAFTAAITPMLPTEEYLKKFNPKVVLHDLPPFVRSSYDRSNTALPDRDIIDEMLKILKEVQP